MGFERKPKVYNIRFAEDHEFHGLEFRMRSVDVDFYKKFVGTAFRLAEFKDTSESEDLAEQMNALSQIADVLDEMRQLFAGKLISWNMEETIEDVLTPIPATIEGVRRLDDKEFQVITSEWLEAVGGVGTDLKKDSISGGAELMLSNLMEPLSPSQAS
jgi:hypothetical protein